MCSESLKLQVKYFTELDSHFEHNLLALLCEQLEKADMCVETKLLVCTVADTFDNFKGRFEKVQKNFTS